MYRSTTPAIILNITNEEFNMEDIDICHITVKSQTGLHKVLYENPEIDIENRRVIVKMTQGETRLFNTGKVKIQMKLKLKDGNVISSKMIYTDIKEILEEEEL